MGRICAGAEMSMKDRFKATQLTGLRALKLVTVPGLVLKNEELGIPLFLVILTLNVIPCVCHSSACPVS